MRFDNGSNDHRGILGVQVRHAVFMLVDNHVVGVQYGVSWHCDPKPQFDVSHIGYLVDVNRGNGFGVIEGNLELAASRD